MWTEVVTLEERPFPDFPLNNRKNDISHQPPLQSLKKHASVKFIVYSFTVSVKEAGFRQSTSLPAPAGSHFGSGSRSSSVQF